jgi:hypothetical protein
MNTTIPYFPFNDDSFKMTMGTQALYPDMLVEVDESCYHADIALKERLLTDEYDEYAFAPLETQPEQWEVLALLLSNMARYYPQHFSLTIHDDEWMWHNRLLNIKTTLRVGEAGSLPYAPLDWLGRQVQEDLLVLSGDVTHGMPLIAGHLCFPNDWCLRDKLGKSFLNIHDPVPLFASTVGHSSSLLLERLKVGRPVWRVNWAFKTTPQLTLTPRYVRQLREEVNEDVTRETIGTRCYLRVERQTLSRLPLTHAILFTVHTYRTPLADIAQDNDAARRMANVVRTTPTEMLAYKGMLPFVDVLLAYLGEIM